MCAPKKNTTKTVKKKSTGTTTAKSSGYFPELTTSAGPESNKMTAKEKFDANPARQYSVGLKKKKKKKAKQAAVKEAATSTTPTTTTTTEETTTTPTTTTTTAPVGTIGTSVGQTSVTPESIYTQDPEEAMEAQELLAQDELRRQRIKRARSKQSLLRRRIERDREVGSGRRVLSGTERELNVQTRQAGTGRRGGTGRRSLITGSTGGIGYYSRFL
jgi:hypothetical protein